MNERIHIVRESVVKLTQLLAGKGINVTQSGINAYVKSDKNGRPVSVNLPYIPDNANSQLIDAIQGFLDHEVAHILFTDFKVTVEANKKGCHQMWNVIEDTRIEREMSNRFQGSALNLTNTGKFFLDKYVTPRLKQAQDEGDNNAIVGSLVVPLIRAMSGQQIFKEYMRDKMGLVADLYDKIKGFEHEIANVKSSADALTVAQKVIKALRDDEPASLPPKSSPPKSPPGSAGEGGEPSDSGEGSGDEPDESEAEHGGAAGSGEGSEESGDGKGEAGKGDPSEEEGEDSGAAGSGKDKGDPSEEEGEGAPVKIGEGKSSSSLSSPVDMSEDCSGSWEAIEKELAKADFDEALMRAITGASAEVAKKADYLIFSKDRDVVEPLRVGRGFESKMLATLEDKVMHLVGPLQKDLERAISARSLSQYSSGHRSGRLHSANLARLALNDSRVFRRKHEATSKDVAVTLLVDMSGSMDGLKISVATQAAFALAQVLERIGISNEVLCFTTGEISDSSEMEAQQKAIGRSFSRVEALYMPVLKSFNERLTIDVRNRFGWLPFVDSMRNNVDGESVEVAALRLLRRRESGKLMMVLSDGAPAAHGNSSTRATLQAHLKKVVKDVAKSGVNIIGIGINSDEVKKYYPKYLILNDVNELPGIVMKELRDVIIR